MDSRVNYQNNKINTEFNLKNNTEGDFYEK